MKKGSKISFAAKIVLLGVFLTVVTIGVARALTVPCGGAITCQYDEHATVTAPGNSSSITPLTITGSYTGGEWTEVASCGPVDVPLPQGGSTESFTYTASTGQSGNINHTVTQAATDGTCGTTNGEQEIGTFSFSFTPTAPSGTGTITYTSSADTQTATFSWGSSPTATCYQETDTFDCGTVAQECGESANVFYTPSCTPTTGGSCVTGDSCSAIDHVWSSGPKTTCTAVAASNCGSTTTPTSTPTSTPNPAPTVTISANPTSLTFGQSTTLTWSSTNATSCMATGAWSGSEPTVGSVGYPPQAMGAQTYTLTCTGPGGSASASATVIVTAAPPANPTSTPTPPIPTPVIPSSTLGTCESVAQSIAVTLNNAQLGLESGTLNSKQLLAMLENLPTLPPICTPLPVCPAWGCNGPEPVGGFPTPTSTPTSTPPTAPTVPLSCDLPVVEAQIKAATSLNYAVSAAQACGLIVNGNQEGDGEGGYVFTQPNGTFVASIGVSY